MQLSRIVLSPSSGFQVIEKTRPIFVNEKKGNSTGVKLVELSRLCQPLLVRKG